MTEDMMSNIRQLLALNIIILVNLKCKRIWTFICILFKWNEEEEGKTFAIVIICFLLGRTKWLFANFVISNAFII